MEQQTDELALIDRARCGDTQAFGTLMQRYTGAVFGIAYRMLGNPQDAEDAAQEIFLRAYTRLDSFDRSRRFSTWLLSVASNYCIDRLRRQRLSWLTLDDVAPVLATSERGPEGQAEQHEVGDEVQAALLKLPDTYRQVTLLYYIHDLSYSEIAQVTGLTESTIKTRLHRARAMLKDLLWTTQSYEGRSTNVG